MHSKFNRLLLSSQEEELFDGDANDDSGTNNRLSRKPTHGSARSPDRNFAVNSLVEDLLANPKISGRLALGAPIPEDNSSCSAISRDRGKLSIAQFY